MGSKIALELEHVDGDNTNNDLSNLKFLCPNCHSMTPTWRGRNIRARRRIAQSAASKAVSKDDNLDAGATPVAPTR